MIIAAGQPCFADQGYRLSLSTLMEHDTAKIEEMARATNEYQGFDLAILYINHIIISDSLKLLDKAISELEKAGAELRDEPLFLVYQGMAEAFLARRRTIFGVENLRRAAAYMEAIAEDYDDWYIRLLRGISYFKLGQGLPGIWPLKEAKDRALELGRKDLEYVIQSHSRNSTGLFQADTYNWENKPVPLEAYDLAREVLGF